MVKQKKILLFQHAGSLGGSNVSLLFTLQSLDRERYCPTVALVFPSNALRAFYVDTGFSVVDTSAVSVFRHTTAGWGKFSNPRSVLQELNNLRLWYKSGRAALALCRQESPDLLHLNSVILAPVADALMRANVPFVWHVREAPVKGYFGLRYSCLRKLLIRAGERVIFISDADKMGWVSGVCGTVVHNFVDLQRFYPGIDPTPAKKKLGITKDNTPTLLYLGGFAEIKGIFVLLEALHLLQKRGVQYRCLMQSQAHDHVLREEEREREAFRATWTYIAMNPVRAGLVGDWKDYPYIGACYPGFWGVDPAADDYWSVTAKLVERSFSGL